MMSWNAGNLRRKISFSFVLNFSLLPFPLLQETVRKAAEATVAVFSDLTQRLLGIIDKNVKTTHLKLAEQIEDATGKICATKLQVWGSRGGLEETSLNLFAVLDLLQFICCALLAVLYLLCSICSNLLALIYLLSSICLIHLL